MATRRIFDVVGCAMLRTSAVRSSCGGSTTTKTTSHKYSSVAASSASSPANSAAVGFASERPSKFELDGKSYATDETWNLSPAVQKMLQRRLLLETSNPLWLLKSKLVNHFHSKYRKPGGRSPMYTICETEPRVVTTYDNFDSLLTPTDHVSSSRLLPGQLGNGLLIKRRTHMRRSSDTYYVSSEHCLRAHTSAHQHGLIRQGLDAFLVVGDVYRRDEVDRTHYPCFHQVEGVRLFTAEQLLGHNEQLNRILEPTTTTTTRRAPERQETHTEDASKALQIDLKMTLEALTDDLFGKKCEKRWVEAYFPFTHPSFELEFRAGRPVTDLVEVLYNGKWLEVLGCGVVEQKLLTSCGVHDKVGWAFGIGLERIAMVLYGIPDIRLFWSKDSGFLSQFEGKNPDESIVYRPISAHPQVIFDISFFLPTDVAFNDMTANVYDIVRSVGGELIEQVSLTDEFENKKKARKSQTYRIVYRSHEKALTKDEVNVVHKNIEGVLANNFNVTLR